MLLLGRIKPLTIYANENLIPILDNVFQDKLSGTYFPYTFVSLSYDGINKLTENNKFEVYSFPLDHSTPTCGFAIKEKLRPRNISKKFVEQYNPSIEDIKAIKQGADYFDKNTKKLFKNEDITIDPPQPFSYVYCSDSAFKLYDFEEIKRPEYIFIESTFLNDKSDIARSKTHDSYPSSSIS